MTLMRMHCIICVLISAFLIASHASAVEIKATSFWVFDSNKVTTANGTNGPAGRFTLGRNRVRVQGGAAASAIPINPLYSEFEGNTKDLNTSVNDASGTFVEANSEMTVAAGVANAAGVKHFDWELEIRAEVDRPAFAKKGTASAKGKDPVPFDLNSLAIDPLFEEEISLGAGSSVLVDSGAESDESAFTFISRATSLLSEPIFRITLIGIPGGGVSAQVFFNSNAALSFSSTNVAVANFLEANAALSTSSGTLATVSLFTYSLNTGDFTVTSTDNVSGEGASFAGQSVPAPSLGWFARGLLPVLLIGLMVGLGTLAAVRRELPENPQKVG